MKGYLQRLVAAVTRNEQRVFPVAGSVFSDPLRDTSKETVSPGAVLQDPHEQSIASTPSENAQERIRVDREQTAAPQPAKLLMPAHVEELSVSPVVPAAAESTGQPAISAGATQERDELREATPLSSKPSRPLELRVMHTTEQRNEDSTVPTPLRLLPASAENPAPIPKINPLPKSQDPIARPAPIKAPPVRRAEDNRATAEKGGDVKIHIGRIEVIATPPAPPRNMRAAPNRFTSLSDYLKRRNGRAG